MTFTSREPFLMNWVLFHLPDKCFIFTSWSLESLLTAVAFKPESTVKCRAENSPVLKQTDGNFFLLLSLILSLV